MVHGRQVGKNISQHLHDLRDGQQLCAQIQEGNLASSTFKRTSPLQSRLRNGRRLCVHIYKRTTFLFALEAIESQWQACTWAMMWPRNASLLPRRRSLSVSLSFSYTFLAREGGPHTNASSSSRKKQTNNRTRQTDRQTENVAYRCTPPESFHIPMTQFPCEERLWSEAESAPRHDKKDGGSKCKKERRTVDTFFDLAGVVLLDFLLWWWSVAGCTTVDWTFPLFTLL